MLGGRYFLCARYLCTHVIRLSPTNLTPAAGLVPQKSTQLTVSNLTGTQEGSSNRHFIATLLASLDLFRAWGWLDLVLMASADVQGVQVQSDSDVYQQVH